MPVPRRFRRPSDPVLAEPAELLELRAQRDVVARAHAEARALARDVARRTTAAPRPTGAGGAAAIDLHGAQNPDFPDRGMARLVLEQTRALLAVAPQRVGALCVSPSLSVPPAVQALGTLQRSTDEPDPVPALFHVPSPLEWGFPLEHVWPAWARRPGIPLVVTLPDLIPLAMPEDYLGLPWEWVAYRARLGLVLAADHVLALSRRTADDAVALLGLRPQDIAVVDAGVAMRFPDRATARAELGGSPFVFTVGGADPRKNLDRLLRAWAAVPADVRGGRRLVVTCSLPPDREAALRETARTAGLGAADLELTGHVDDDRLAALYAACDLFVFPSRYEGFGLPVLEAMAAGAPVVASSASTGPELLGGTEGTFDPEDEAAITAAVAEALGDPERLATLRARSAERAPGFTWERSADLTLQGYDAALAAVADRGHAPVTARMA